MSVPDPFEILELEPTRDRAAIKRAYFKLLPRYAPHDDPAGFRRLRDAYETLMGSGLAKAWMDAKLDVARELEAIERELGPRIEAATQAWAVVEARRAAITAFEAALRLDLASAKRRISRAG